jgi:hypothetical protein
MGFDLSGKIVSIGETVQRSATFKTREFVVETNFKPYKTEPVFLIDIK